MVYEFMEINNGHKYQLVQPGLLWNSWYNVYVDPTPIGRLDVCVTYKGKNFTSGYKSSADANRLVQVLKKLGIQKADLQKTKFPKGTEQRVLNAWEHILAWLPAAPSNALQLV